MKKSYFKEKAKHLVVLLLAIFIIFQGLSVFESCCAEQQDNETEKFQLDLEQVVITATRVDEKIKQIPKNVTVITSEEIAQAPSNNIVDLLSREADLNLRSFLGHDGQAGVDIRGMGETFVSNVIVMVDGYRLNASDLSGANLSSIPLGSIERIEIVRGGASVMYGNGAVGGVINIITKHGPSARPGAGLYTSYGSWDTFDSRICARGKAGGFWANIDSSYYDSDGYRDNGYFRKKDLRFDLGYQINPFITLDGEVALHHDQMGLPGPVSSEDAGSRSKRRDSSFPHDFAKTTDCRYRIGLTVDSSWGTMILKAGYRDRENPYILGYSPLLDKDEQTDKITEDTWQINLSFQKRFELLGRESRFLVGLDTYETDYLREDAKTQRKNGDMETIEWFCHEELDLTQDLRFSIGFRTSRFKGNFRDDYYQDFYTEPVLPPPVFIPPQYLYSAWVKGRTREKVWYNNAYELGLIWQATRELSLFASHSKSYRIPNVDELALADPDLHPQKGFHWDLGGRYQFDNMAELTLTLFQIQIEDEIYYGEDPVTHQYFNRNYDDKTRRRGVELQIKLYPSKWLDIWGNYTWLEAVFEKRDTFVPLVPKHKATIGLELYPISGFTFSMVGTYVSSRYDGNDQDNNLYDKLDDYFTVDCKLTWQQGRYRVFAGINNVFDELYCTSAYSGFQYPMPTRSFYGGLELRF